MDINRLLENIAYGTKKLVKRAIINPFTVSLCKESNNREIDIVGDWITILRGFLVFVIVIVLSIKINTHLFSEKYIENIVGIFSMSNDIFLAIFGVVLTAFSITTALWSNMAVKAISGNKSEGTFSIFEELLLSYVSILFWSIIIIVINFILVSCLDSLPNDWTIGVNIFGKHGVDVIATISMIIYFGVVFDILLYNIDLLFNMYTAIVVAAYFRVKEQDEKEKQDEEKASND